MTWLAVFISALLLVPAALHLLWAIGAWMPIRDEAALARATVGAPGITKMPGPIPCALVFVALSFAASLPHLTTFPQRSLLLLSIAAVFLLRGIAAYLPAWRKLVPEEPFATLDQRYYGPLCLVLGASFLLFTLTGA
ncbi:MAG: DUF3995 domain-containing protein [Shimia sp.]|uniref:DUF3995 domain-containing protein n=1 Tax=Shimia sp. TaxID=1954381 RepID=UPI001B2AEFF8|nr:DUF3995 domain-containing protein [Shimia sp.]MBO6896690.1 DUF3995 domain-containing protein [Shimia sp.]